MTEKASDVRRLIKNIASLHNRLRRIKSEGAKRLAEFFDEEIREDLLSCLGSYREDVGKWEEKEKELRTEQEKAFALMEETFKARHRFMVSLLEDLGYESTLTAINELVLQGHEEAEQANGED